MSKILSQVTRPTNNKSSYISKSSDIPKLTDDISQSVKVFSDELVTKDDLDSLASKVSKPIYGSPDGVKDSLERFDLLAKSDPELLDEVSEEINPDLRTIDRLLGKFSEVLTSKVRDNIELALPTQLNDYVSFKSIEIPEIVTRNYRKDIYNITFNDSPVRYQANTNYFLTYFNISLDSKTPIRIVPPRKLKAEDVLRVSVVSEVIPVGRIKVDANYVKHNGNYARYHFSKSVEGDTVSEMEVIEVTLKPSIYKTRNLIIDIDFDRLIVYPQSENVLEYRINSVVWLNNGVKDSI